LIVWSVEKTDRGISKVLLFCYSGSLNVWKARLTSTCMRA
jgi:hypothetical protein